MVMKMIVREESIQLLRVLVVVLLLYGNTPALGVSSQAKIRCIKREKLALLNFKQALEDSSGMLSSWGSEEDKRDCCKWRGVRCNNRTGHVTELDLHGSSYNGRGYLEGMISPSLRELHHLKYLDLSENYFGGNSFPDAIASFKRLQYLNLGDSSFYGPIPHQLGNLSSLRYLALGSNEVFDGGNLEWLSNLSLLRHLDLNFMDLSQATNWVETINSLPLLENLDLNQCTLPNVVLPLHPFNSSLSLEVLDLSQNYLSSSIYSWVFNLSSSLVYLALHDNLLNGPFPDSFGNMISLVHLSLSRNQLDGTIPKSFSNLSHLQLLEVSDNHLTGELPKFAQKSLQVLNVNGNQLSGAFPESFGQLLSLQWLDLGNNKLSGTVTRSIGGLSKLEYFDMFSNALEGMISEEHFANLFNLKHLDLSFNPLVLNISSDWVPPFQLDIIRLSSCKLGSYFPKWLQNQSEFSELDISGAGISDVVPSWFWNLPPRLVYLNLGSNQLNGLLPDLSLNFSGFPVIDLSSNCFRGRISRVSSRVVFLDISKNRISGSISSLCAITNYVLLYLDLSSNRLSGSFPNCWEQLSHLGVINLANNNLSGELPSSMGLLDGIEVLQLRNNSFYGELPTSLKNCKTLKILDVGDNRFTGKIEAWIGMHLTRLIILNLRTNNFYGGMPQNICRLNYIQVLDFSQNDLSGGLPKCLNNFSALIQNDSLKAPQFWYETYLKDQYPSIHSEVNALVQWKGQEREYRKNLGLLKYIDLSSNKLVGNIPEEVVSLTGLISLNLSRNNLTGKIFQEIGQMKMLESFDLSRNRLSGKIPTSLARLNYLSVLDLSNNNFSGKIPLGTQLQSFNASAYSGNPELCGLPLPNKCPGEEMDVKPHGKDTRTQEEEEEEEDRFITPWFYISMGLGFAAGFLAVFGAMLFSSSSRYAYFKFLDCTIDWLYVTIAVSIARLQRRFPR